MLIWLKSNGPETFLRSVPKSLFVWTYQPISVILPELSPFPLAIHVSISFFILENDPSHTDIVGC